MVVVDSFWRGHEKNVAARSPSLAPSLPGLLAYRVASMWPNEITLSWVERQTSDNKLSCPVS